MHGLTALFCYPTKWAFPSQSLKASAQPRVHHRLFYFSIPLQYAGTSGSWWTVWEPEVLTYIHPFKYVLSATGAILFQYHEVSPGSLEFPRVILEKQETSLLYPWPQAYLGFYYNLLFLLLSPFVPICESGNLNLSSYPFLS